MNINTIRWLRVGSIAIACFAFMVAVYLQPWPYYSMSGSSAMQRTILYMTVRLLACLTFLFAIYLLRTDADQYVTPALKKIVLYDERGLEIVSGDGRYELAGNVKVCVHFAGITDMIYLYMLPEGTPVLSCRTQIAYLFARVGIDKRRCFGRTSGVVEFIWKVPSAGGKGYLGIELINGNRVRYLPKAVNFIAR